MEIFAVKQEVNTIMLAFSGHHHSIITNGSLGLTASYFSAFWKPIYNKKKCTCKIKTQQKIKKKTD
jgi:hypothetical protein